MNGPIKQSSNKGSLVIWLHLFGFISGLHYLIIPMQDKCVYSEREDFDLLFQKKKLSQLYFF